MQPSKVLRKLVLHETLADQFGSEHYYYANNIKELIEGVGATVDGLVDVINSENEFCFFDSDELSEDTAIDEYQILLNFTDDQTEIHVYPVLEGAASNGEMLIFGLVVVGLGIWLGGAGFAAGSTFWSGVSSSLITSGSATALSGAVSLFQDTPENTTDDGGSIFGSSQNNGSENTTCPLWYGYTRANGVIVNQSVQSDLVRKDSLGEDVVDHTAEIQQKLMYVVSEGPCIGPYNPSITNAQDKINGSILINDIPIGNNFDDVKTDYRAGEENQSPVLGFQNSVQGFASNLTLESGQGKTINISSDVDNVVLNIKYPTGCYYQKDTGSFRGSSTSFKIFVNTGNGFEYYDQRITKTANRQQFILSYEVVRPNNTTGAWSIRLERQGPVVESKTSTWISSNVNQTRTYNTTTYPEHQSSPEGSSNASGHQNQMILDSYNEVKEGRETYSGSTLYTIDVDSDDLKDPIRDISFVGRGRECWVPFNYDPETDTHSGPFIGTLKKAWTNNCAYVLLDMIYSDDVYGQYIDKSIIDLPAFYRAGLMASARNFTFNAQITKSNNATQVLNSVASTMLAKLVKTVDGKVSLTWANDSTNPIKTINVGEIINGHIQYTGGNINTATTQVTGIWQNPQENFKSTTLSERSDSGVQDRGVIPLQLELLGVSNESQARTICRHALLTNSGSLRTLEFVLSWTGANLVVGDIVKINDSYNNLITDIKITDIDLSNTEMGMYTIRGVQFDSTIYNQAAAGSNASDPFQYLPSVQKQFQQHITPVQNLKVREIASAGDAATPNSNLLVEWEQPATGKEYVKFYQLQYKFGGGIVSNVTNTTGLSHVLTNIESGLHVISVRPIGIAGNKAARQTINYEVRGVNESGEADQPNNLKIPNGSNGSGNTSFGGRDLTVTWDDANILNLRRYEVEFWSTTNPPVLMKTSHVQKNQYVNSPNTATLLFAENFATQNQGQGITGAQRQIKVKVFAVDTASRRSSVLERTFTNSNPNTINIVSTEVGSHTLNIQLSTPNDDDLAGNVCYASTNANDLLNIPPPSTQVYKGESNIFQIAVDPATRTYIRCAAYDEFWNGTPQDLNLSNMESELSHAFRTAPNFKANLTWSVDAAGDVDQSAGTIDVTDVNGKITTYNLNFKEHNYSAGQQIFYKWTVGSSATFSTTSSFQDDNTVILAAYDGETLQVGNGEPFSSGSTMIAGTFTGNLFESNTLIVRSSANIKDLTVDSFKIKGASVNTIQTFSSLAFRRFYPDEGWKINANDSNFTYPPSYFYSVPADNLPSVRLHLDFSMNITMHRKSSNPVDRYNFDPVYLDYQVNGQGSWINTGPIATVITDNSKDVNLVKCRGRKDFSFAPGTNLEFRLDRDFFLLMSKNTPNSYYDFCQIDRPSLVITTVRR